MNIEHVVQAMHRLMPDGGWACHDTYESIAMVDGGVKPTKGEFDAAVVECLAEETANAYKSLRKAEYPDIGDQLDAIWTQLSAKSMTAEAKAIHDKIKAIKTEYPKE